MLQIAGADTMRVRVRGRGFRAWIALFAFSATLAGACVLTPAAAQAPIRYDGHAVVRVAIANEAELAQLLALNLDIWTDAIGIGPLDVRVAPDEWPSLWTSGLPFEPRIVDVQALIDAATASSAAAGAPIGGGPFGGAPLGGVSWFADYKTYDEVLAQLVELAAARPDLVTLIDVGVSVEGRLIRAVRVTGTAGSNKPGFYIEGCQHAREWVAVMAPVYAAWALVEFYDLDPEIHALMDSVEFFIVPIVNPDGYVYSHAVDRLWRKNRRVNGDGTIGVDLNRNWSYEWGGPGSSPATSSPVYHGTGPFSEPESSAARDFVLARPQIAAFLDVHSYSQLLLQPFGYTVALPPDQDFYHPLGAEITAAIGSVHGATYLHGPGGLILYVASGTAQDWGYGVASAVAMTIELRDTGQFGFLLPADQILPTCEEVFAGLRVLGDTISRPFAFNFPQGLPARAAPGATTMFPVDVHAIGGATLAAGSPRIHTRSTGGGAFVESPLEFTGGTLYTATLPAAPCGSSIEFYFTAASATGGSASGPIDAPGEVYATPVELELVAFSDDGESELGYVVSGDAIAGVWNRGVPAGGGDRGDPPFDADGSGQCYLTDLADGDTDVDGGSTILTSPLFDATGGNATLSYYRWYSNVAGGTPEQDVFVVEISNDGGGSWVVLEVVGPAGAEVQGGWIARSFAIADTLAPTAAMRVRFTASDVAPGSVVEAGVDGIVVGVYGCLAVPPSFIRGDANADSHFNIADAVFTLVYVFGGNASSCQLALDANDDEAVNIADPIFLLTQLFAGGAPPPGPYPGCGIDPTPGSLTCDAYAPCP
ncbi:MAG: M14 family metallopeptidase [Planctomycetota bacterium]